MKRTALNALILVLALFLGSGNLSLLASSGQDAAAFLNIPVGSGPAALGSAYSALATDAYAPVWNPAGLGFLPSTQIAGQHLSYLESIHHEYVSFVHPFRPGHALGASAQYVGSGDIAATGPTGNSLGNFSTVFGAYSLAYGQTVTEKLSLGLTGKLIHAKLADVSATAYGCDVGTLYQPGSKFQLAAVLANMGSNLTFIKDGDPLPMALRLGGAYQVRQWTLSLEGVFPKRERPSGRTGIEWRPIELLSLRAGYRTDTIKELSSLAGFSTGAGIHLWDQEFAYAWLPYDELGSTQYFSLILRFGGKGDSRRNLIRYHTIQPHAMTSVQGPIPEDLSLEQLLKYDDKQPLAQTPAPEPVR